MPVSEGFDTNRPNPPAAVWKPIGFSFKPGLRSRLIAFFTLSLILPTLASAAIAFFAIRQSLLKGTFREQKELSRRIAERLGAHVDGAKRGLEAFPAEQGMKYRDAREQAGALRKLLATYPDVLEASLFDEEGKGLVRAARSGDRIVWGLEPSSRSGREEFETASRGRKYVGPVFFTSRLRVPQMFLAAPAGGRRVLLARLGLSNIWSIVRESAGPTALIFVVDGKGRLLAHPETDRVLAHENWAERSVVRAFMENQSGQEGFSIDTGEGPSRALAVFHRVPGLDWAAFVEVPYRVALAPIRRLGLRVVAAAAGLGVLFWIIGFSLVNRILRPLGDLQNGLQRIGRGDLSHRMDIRTGDELQRVAEALNEAATSLGNIEKTKRDLIHMIVHDLKSPLSATLGSIDYVLYIAKDTLPPEQKKLLSLGSKSGKDLLRLIQNLLDMAKMEEGKLEIHRERFSLLELAGQCVDDLEAQIMKESKVISVEVSKRLPKAWADRDLVHRVLANLLTNALKHTPPKTEISIHVRLTEDEKSLLMSVKDNGAGIPLEFQKRIFEKYGQAEARRQNQRVGSGLGLTFCKLAVEAHGGTIWVDSEPGRGSEFIFSLPLPKPGEASPPDAGDSSPASKPFFLNQGKKEPLTPVSI